MMLRTCYGSPCEFFFFLYELCVCQMHKRTPERTYVFFSIHLILLSEIRKWHIPPAFTVCYTLKRFNHLHFASSFVGWLILSLFLNVQTYFVFFLSLSLCLSYKFPWTLNTFVTPVTPHVHSLISSTDGLINHLLLAPLVHSTPGL